MIVVCLLYFALEWGQILRLSPQGLAANFRDVHNILESLSCWKSMLHSTTMNYLVFVVLEALLGRYGMSKCSEI